MESRSEGSHEDADDDRTACYTELDRRTDTRYDDRNASEDESEDYADENREQVRVCQAFGLVSEYGAHVLYRSGFSDDSELVSELEAEISGRKKVDAGSVHAGDVDAV